MKFTRLAGLLVMVIIAITLTGCTDNPNIQPTITNTQPPITIEVGAYGFNSAIITDKETGESVEYTQAEVLQSSTHPWWKTLIGFNLRITAEDIFYNHELTKGGRTYHLVANNTLKTYCEEKGCDIEVTMTKQKVYGGNGC